MTLPDAHLKEIERNIERCPHLFAAPKSERNPAFSEDVLVVTLPQVDSLAWRQAVEDNLSCGTINREQRMFLLELFGFS